MRPATAIRRAAAILPPTRRVSPGRRVSRGQVGSLRYAQAHRRRPCPEPAWYVRDTVAKLTDRSASTYSTVVLGHLYVPGRRGVRSRGPVRPGLPLTPPAERRSCEARAGPSGPRLLAQELRRQLGYRVVWHGGWLLRPGPSFPPPRPAVRSKPSCPSPNAPTDVRPEARSSIATRAQLATSLCAPTRHSRGERDRDAPIGRAARRFGGEG